MTKTKGKKSLLIHIDGADFYTSNYEWEINGKKFIQFCTDPRPANSYPWNTP